MAETILLLHGIANTRPPEHWQFWLAGQLVDRGQHVAYPQLPNPDDPRLEQWRAVLLEHVAATGGQCVVICHSLSCLLWLHAADAVAELGGVERLLFVAPPASEAVPPAGAEFRIAAVDGDAVRSSVRGGIHIACSDNDPYDPSGAAATLARALGATRHLMPGAAHINPDAGYGRWPAVLAWCTDAGAPLTVN